MRKHKPEPPEGTERRSWKGEMSITNRVSFGSDSCHPQFDEIYLGPYAKDERVAIIFGHLGRIKVRHVEDRGPGGPILRSEEGEAGQKLRDSRARSISLPCIVVRGADGHALEDSLRGIHGPVELISLRILAHKRSRKRGAQRYTFANFIGEFIRLDSRENGGRGGGESWKSPSVAGERRKSTGQTEL